MKDICVITDGYPYNGDSRCVFVRELLSEFVKKGVRCTVVTPQMVYPGKKKRLPDHFVDEVGNGKVIDVYAPGFLSVSSRGPLMRITMRNHLRAVMKQVRALDHKPEVFYGHFLYLNGLTAIRAAKKLGAKAFAVCGENTNRLKKGSEPYANGLKHNKWAELLKQTSGIICVSGENRRLLLENGFIDESVPTCVIPNAVNTEVFYPRDRAAARRKLGLSDGDFLAAFVGAFSERKGSSRVDEALAGLDGIKTMFIGSGELTPKSDCVFCGRLPHADVPEYLSAADVFVLPTTGEGCCNAIVEALSCGLPVVSSNGSFNDDILSEKNSIRIDPMKPEEIREAVLKMYKDRELYASLKEYVDANIAERSLSNRADAILAFIDGRKQNEDIH